MKLSPFIFLACAASVAVSQAAANNVMKHFSLDGQLLSNLPADAGDIGFGKDCKQSQCFYIENDPIRFSTNDQKNLQQQRRHDPSAKYSMDNSETPTIGYSWKFGE